MENIKKQLLENIEDINTLVDFNNDNDQLIYLSSRIYSEEAKTYYELMIEVIAFMKEVYDNGDYHADQGDYEGRGSHWVISSIGIQSISIFNTDGEDVDINITQKEAAAYITF